MLNEVLLGYNCTLFAYGQTGTGKTSVTPYISYILLWHLMSHDTIVIRCMVMLNPHQWAILLPMQGSFLMFCFVFSMNLKRHTWILSWRSPMSNFKMKSFATFLEMTFHQQIIPYSPWEWQRKMLKVQMEGSRYIWWGWQAWHFDPRSWGNCGTGQRLKKCNCSSHEGQWT